MIVPRILRSLLLLAPGIRCKVRPAEPRALGHVQVVATETARSGRIEVELRPVERERRTAVEVRTVDDWAEGDGRRPGIERGGSRRYPDVLTALAAGAIGGDEDFQPVAPDGNAVVRELTRMATRSSANRLLSSRTSAAGPKVPSAWSVLA